MEDCNAPGPNQSSRDVNQELSALLARRRQLRAMLGAEQHCLLYTSSELVRQDIVAHIVWLTSRLTTAEADLVRALQSPLGDNVRRTNCYRAS